MTETSDVITKTFGTPDSTSNGRVKLTDFEGLPVDESGIEIPDAAGGLREALKVDPVELHKNERVHIVLACDVAKIRHDPLDSGELDGPQRRVHVLKTAQATIVDRELVGDALSKQAERLARAKEIAGQQSLDDATGPPLEDYDSLNAVEIIGRIEDLGDTDDEVELVDRVEEYEKAHGGRATILKAIDAWRAS